MTPQDLASATGARIDRATENLPWIAVAMDSYDINTPERQAAFLAQTSHESGGFHWLNEIWGPSETQRRYELRQDLGNNEPGDGFRYRGRGWIQLTGRNNYRDAYARLKHRFGDQVPDFEMYPDTVATARWAAMTAADFWHSHGCNDLADIGDFEQITREINGGLNGYEERQALWKQAKEALA